MLFSHIHIILEIDKSTIFLSINIPHEIDYRTYFVFLSLFCPTGVKWPSFSFVPFVLEDEDGGDEIGKMIEIYDSKRRESIDWKKKIIQYFLYEDLSVLNPKVISYIIFFKHVSSYFSDWIHSHHVTDLLFSYSTFSIDCDWWYSKIYCGRKISHEYFYCWFI